MPLIWKSGLVASPAEFALEADIEEVVREIAPALFGADRIYINVKKLMGTKGFRQNIPDGYLLDLSGREPMLYFVEVETKQHDLYKHILAQVMQFKVAFESNRPLVKQILREALIAAPDQFGACEAYAKARSFDNVDRLLDIVTNKRYAAIVVIDEVTDESILVLTGNLKFVVEVLTVERFTDEGGQHSYLFEPFLQDVRRDLAASEPTSKSETMEPGDLDTIVVPAREDGFEQVFIGENEWRSVRLHASMKDQIKYVAAYQVAPISAITRIGTVRDIVPSEEEGKWRLLFDGPAKPIGPITLVPNGSVLAPRNIRYTTRARLLESKTLDEVWPTATEGE